MAKKITVTLEDQLHVKLRIRCFSEKTSLQDAVVELIESWVDSSEVLGVQPDLIIEDEFVEEPEVTDVQRGETTGIEAEVTVTLKRIKDGQLVDVPWNAYNALTDKQKANYELVDKR